MDSKINLLILVLLTIICCKKTENLKQDLTLSHSYENLVIDSVSVKESIKMSDSFTFVFNHKMLIFPELKDKNLLDSIYNYPKKYPVSDFSINGVCSAINDKKKGEVDLFVKNYREIQDRYKVDFWNDNYEMKLKSFRNGYLQVEFYEQSGPQKTKDFYQISEKVFDMKTHKKLHISDITGIDKNKLSHILKNYLINMNDVKQLKKNNSKLYDEMISTPINISENFYFDDKNIYFIYNINEIQNLILNRSVPVSWEELKGTLNPEFKERMKIK